MSNTVRTGGNEPNNATTLNTFGKSVESDAQIADAARTGSSVSTGSEKLNLYKLLPIAEADDPRWTNSPYQGGCRCCKNIRRCPHRCIRPRA